MHLSPLPTLNSPVQSLTESLRFPSIPPRIRAQHNTPRIDACHMYFFSFPILSFMSYLAICIFLKDCQMSIMIYFHIVLFKMLYVMKLPFFGEHPLLISFISQFKKHLLCTNCTSELREAQGGEFIRRMRSSISIKNPLNKQPDALLLQLFSLFFASHTE